MNHLQVSHIVCSLCYCVFLVPMSFFSFGLLLFIFPGLFSAVCYHCPTILSNKVPFLFLPPCILFLLKLNWASENNGRSVSNSFIQCCFSHPGDLSVESLPVLFWFYFEGFMCYVLWPFHALLFRSCLALVFLMPQVPTTSLSTHNTNHKYICFVAQISFIDWYISWGAVFNALKWTNNFDKNTMATKLQRLILTWFKKQNKNTEGNQKQIQEWLWLIFSQ